MESCTIATFTLQIDPKRIGYLKFILEGYDGMALVTTINAKEGAIIIRYPSFFHDDLMAIIGDVAPLILKPHAE
jgi:hypothetical protein